MRRQQVQIFLSGQLRSVILNVIISPFQNIPAVGRDFATVGVVESGAEDVDDM